MRFLIYDTATEAQSAVTTIDNRARAVFAAQGYTVREDGAVVGKSEGCDDPDGLTTTWDVPRQRLDGKWAVAHPEQHPSAAFQVAPGLPLASYLVTSIDTAVEDESPAWWPPAAGDA